MSGDVVTAKLKPFHRNQVRPGSTEYPSVAVLIPCYDEEKTIGKVVSDYYTALPHAKIYVYDNNSTDRTAEVARDAGAFIRRESRQGKGNVIRRMFADVDADVYLMVDGDGTYNAVSAPRLIDTLLENNLDMVVGTRMTNYSDVAFPRGHHLGNRLLTGTVRFLFGQDVTDMLSGYRVFSKRFAKSFPALSKGFETETELTVHALELRMPVGEVETNYGNRPEGSTSKLNTYRDGIRILGTIFNLFKDHRPTQFFSLVSFILMSIALLLAYPIFTEYLETGLVPRFPTAILATGLTILAFLALTSGFILDSVIRGRREIKRLHYLSFSSPNKSSEQTEHDV